MLAESASLWCCYLLTKMPSSWGVALNLHQGAHKHKFVSHGAHQPDKQKLQLCILQDVVHKSMLRLAAVNQPINCWKAIVKQSRDRLATSCLAPMTDRQHRNNAPRQ